MALDWLPIVPDHTRPRRTPHPEVTCVEPLRDAYTPAPDILAALVFFPSLPQPTPRPRRSVQQAVIVAEPFDTATRIDPLVWQPQLGMPRLRPGRPREERVVIDPTFGYEMRTAERLSWATRAVPPQRQARSDREAVTLAAPPFIATLLASAGCVDLVDAAASIPLIILEAVVETDLVTEARTHTDLIQEALC